MSRRDQIRMSDDEVKSFLEGSQTIILNSIAKDGVPHPMPMWFAVEDDGSVVMSTFAKSQKIANLRRDPRVSLLAEAGKTYSELRGVVIYGAADLVSGVDDIVGILEQVTTRAGNTPADTDREALRGVLRKTAEKRVGIRIKPDKVVSWDHRKLGGKY